MNDSERAEPEPATEPVTDRAADTFEHLADLADAVARTADRSARVHDGMVDRDPDAAEHAERDRLLAAAERAAAAAYRSGQVPPPDVRQAIRDAGTGPAADD